MMELVYAVALLPYYWSEGLRNPCGGSLSIVPCPLFEEMKLLPADSQDGGIRYLCPYQ